MLLFKWFNFVLCLASLATAGIGELIIAFFEGVLMDSYLTRHIWIWPLRTQRI
jgi:hypothetical protein